MKHKLSPTAWLTPAAAFLLSACLWVIVIAAFGFYPFGDHSILITDMAQQYTEYHLALYDVLHGNGSLLFTWNTGMGVSFLGIYAYYLASPFTFLILFFSRAAVPDALLLIISLKIASAGCTFSIFLKRAVRVDGILNPLFSALYALSAYTVVFLFNIMWLDAVVLLPLVVLATVHLIRERKAVPLAVALTVLFFTNFYTAYMVGFFCLLALIAVLWVRARPFRENARVVGLFFGATAVAALLTAVLTLPTFLALMDSQGTGVSQLYLGFTSDPLTLLSKFTWGAYDSVTDSGTANLYCGMLSFGLLPVWFLHRDFSKREKIAAGVLAAFLLFSILFNPLDIFWHACETPVWFPCRYSFVLIFLVLTGAAAALSRPGGLTAPRVLGGFLLSAALVVAAKVPEWVNPDKFHTMKGNLGITLAALAVYAVLILGLLLRKRAWLRGAGMFLLTICVGAESAGNAVTSLNRLNKELRFDSRSSISYYLTRSADLTASLKSYAAAEGDALSADNFYRVENSDAYNPNDGLTGGYPSISHYSSFSRQSTFSFLKNCGMYCTSGNKILRYFGSTAALDALFGVHYIYAVADYRAEYLSTPVVTDGLTLYRNVNTLPIAYFADTAVQNLPSSSSSPFSLLNTFYSSFDGQACAYYSPLNVETTCVNGVLSYSSSRSVVSTDTSATLHFLIDNVRDQDVLLYLNNNFPETIKIYVNGQLLNPQGERYIRSVIDIGPQPEGEIDVSVAVGNKRWFSGLQAMSFDESTFDDLVDSLRQNVPETLTVTADSLGKPVVAGRLTAPHDGTLFTSIPADPGWTAYVDGKKTDTVAAGGAFLTVPVTAGEHSFELRFQPRGLTAGCAISGTAAVLCAAGAVIRRIRRKKRKEKAKPAEEPGQ